jgi:hypothetical protein
LVQRAEQAAGQPRAHGGVIGIGVGESPHLVKQGVAAGEIVLGLGVVQRVEQAAGQMLALAWGAVTQLHKVKIFPSRLTLRPRYATLLKSSVLCRTFSSGLYPVRRRSRSRPREPRPG